MSASVKIDTTAWNRMCRDLARLTGKSQEHVVKYEFAKVMEACVRLTPAAKPIVRAEREFGYYHGLDGEMRNYYLLNRYPDALWSSIQQQSSQLFEKIKRARGLAKKSWWTIARLAGLDISAPGYAKKAIARTGKEYPDDFSAVAGWQRGGFFIRIENALPYIVQLGGERILQRAIKQRVSYFVQNLKRKVFESAANTAKRYPGVKTT